MKYRLISSVILHYLTARIKQNLLPLRVCFFVTAFLIISLYNFMLDMFQVTTRVEGQKCDCLNHRLFKLLHYRYILSLKQTEIYCKNVILVTAFGIFLH